MTKSFQVGGLFYHLEFDKQKLQVKLNHFTNFRGKQLIFFDATTFSFHPILSIGFQSPHAYVDSYKDFTVVRFPHNPPPRNPLIQQIPNMDFLLVVGKRQEYPIYTRWLCQKAVSLHVLCRCNSSLAKASSKILNNLQGRSIKDNDSPLTNSSTTSVVLHHNQWTTYISPSNRCCCPFSTTPQARRFSPFPGLH